MEIFKIRRRPKNDPLSWIRQGEFVEGDEIGSPYIQGVTNRPLKQLLENDLELLRHLEQALGLVQNLDGSSLQTPWHLDVGSGLFHLDVSYDPNRKTYISSRNVYQDHTDLREAGSHLDHDDHLDIPHADQDYYQDVSHEDRTTNVPHGDYTDHANAYTDHGDVVNRPHGDAAYVNHSDHADSMIVFHQDHSDHLDVHTDFYNPPPTGHVDSHCDNHSDSSSHQDCNSQPPYSDFSPPPTGYSCAVLPQALVARSSYSCSPSGAHYDYTDHADYQPDAYTHYDFHGGSPVWGWQHQDLCSSFKHVDGHREWFYSDYSIHYDYPDDFQDHLDRFSPNHTDHQDSHCDNYANHIDHGDSHGDHNDYSNSPPGNTYVNHSDHVDIPHLDQTHVNHSDHQDAHQDYPQVHQDHQARTVHQDLQHANHSDHQDTPHGDSEVPHGDYTPEGQEAVYHLDIPPEHFDAAHWDRGSYSQEDVSSGIYEVVYEGVWHGDRIWHADEDTHGDVAQGSEVHTDHNDLNAHVDAPHGDTPHQDVLDQFHGDTLVGPVHNDHMDHVDGVPPFQVHADQLRVEDNRVHMDHTDWAHLDYHLDAPHGDESYHQDRTEISQAHVDTLHQDHLDHSDWDHEDHSDLGADLRFRQFITYSDHGDYTIHSDIPHTDSMNHNDYYPEHDDHYDHYDQPHGDRPEEYFHEDETVPPSHLDISVPHQDLHSDHADAGAGSHADFHADHTDHGDFSSQGRHGDFTYSTPHLDLEHLDTTIQEEHFDGPLGPAHNDFYYHSDYPHVDEARHSDYVSY